METNDLPAIQPQSHGSGIKQTYTEAMRAHLERSTIPIQNLVDDFPKYANQHQIARFLARYELLKMVLDVPGCIMELGAQNGAGLLAFARLSNILEMRGGLYRVVYGFDTFTGLPEPSDRDGILAKPGDMACHTEDMLLDIVKASELAKMEAGIGKIQCYRGDFKDSGPTWCEQHPEALISLLFCDFAMYAPTKLALELFVPRMAKGSIIVFESLNKLGWPGERQALADYQGNFMNLRTLKKFTWHPTLSYMVL